MQVCSYVYVLECGMVCLYVMSVWMKGSENVCVCVWVGGCAHAHMHICVCVTVDAYMCA